VRKHQHATVTTQRRPMLQPCAMREPYPSSRPPTTWAMALRQGIRKGRLVAGHCLASIVPKVAPRIIPTLVVLTEFAKKGAVKALVLPFQ